MSEPLVACVMLVNGRESMVRRAVASFRAQTYRNARLLIWDTGPRGHDLGDRISPLKVIHCWPAPRASIGLLRNAANAAAGDLRSDIIVHMDSDDVSHPNRIDEQVAFLQSSGADAVGYREVMFWRSTCEWCGTDAAQSARLHEGPHTTWCLRENETAGQAWIYTSRHPSWFHGASLCYWRSAWEKHPFPDLNVGEDLVWQAGLKRASVSAIKTPVGHLLDTEPRLICGLHGGNTSAAIVPDASEWKRAEIWDAHIRAIWEAK